MSRLARRSRPRCSPIIMAAVAGLINCGWCDLRGDSATPPPRGFGGTVLGRVYDEALPALADSLSSSSARSFELELDPVTKALGGWPTTAVPDPRSSGGVFASALPLGLRRPLLSSLLSRSLSASSCSRGSAVLDDSREERADLASPKRLMRPLSEVQSSPTSQM